MRFAVGTGASMFSRSRAKRALEAAGLGFVVRARRRVLARLNRPPRGVLTRLNRPYRRMLAHLNQPPRGKIIRRQIRGQGLEIGALHAPQQTPKGVEVEYVDLYTKAECTQRYPDLPADLIVEPDHLEDGFTLASIPAASQDFVLASHTLEHSPDPIGALRTWVRVTRPGGVVFVIVPIAENCFDAGREETGIEHLVEDHRLSELGDRERMRERNGHHYREWVTISEPAMFAESGQPPTPPSEEDTAHRVEVLLDGDVEIHFHTFSPASFKRLLETFCERWSPNSHIVEFDVAPGEIVAVLRVGS